MYVCLFVCLWVLRPHTEKVIVYAGAGEEISWTARRRRRPNWNPGRGPAVWAPLTWWCWQWWSQLSWWWWWWWKITMMKRTQVGPPPLCARLVCQLQAIQSQLKQEWGKPLRWQQTTSTLLSRSRISSSCFAFFSNLLLGCSGNLLATACEVSVHSFHHFYQHFHKIQLGHQKFYCDQSIAVLNVWTQTWLLHLWTRVEKWKLSFWIPI